MTSYGFSTQGALGLLNEGRSYYKRAGLDRNQVIQHGAEVQLLTWRGDWLNDALVLMLAQHRLTASNEGLVISVSGGSKERVLDALDDIAQLETLDPEKISCRCKKHTSGKVGVAHARSHGAAFICVPLPRLGGSQGYRPSVSQVGLAVKFRTNSFMC